MRCPVCQVLKEFCDRQYWAAPKYDIDTTLGGFVCVACMEAPKEVGFAGFTPELRKALCSVTSAPSRTHKDAKESSAQKMLVLLHDAGIRL